MMLPLNTTTILTFLGHDVSMVTVEESRGAVAITHWSAPTAQPTEQEINDAGNDLTVVSGQTFSQWFAEHGGDAILTLRRQAKEELDEQRAANAMFRAAIKEVLVYARDAHSNLNALLDAIDAASNLAALKTAAAAIVQSPAPVNDTTLFSGARTQIKARIDSGEGDT